MRSLGRKVAVLAVAGVLALGLVALLQAMQTASSGAPQDAMQNCPHAGKWAISVWEGPDGTDTGQALAKEQKGEVLIAGQRMDTLSESARAVLRRQTVGFVFQAYNLIPNLTVADNVDLPGLLAGRSPAEMGQRRQTLLEALGIADKARAFPGELSGGEQQRVAIARALGNRPTVLLVDEPTGNLDSRSGGEVMALLRRFQQAGQTIVLVTHDPKVASFAGRVIFMRDGRLVEEASLATPGDAAAVLSRLIQLET